MRPRTAKETAIICAAAVVAIGVLTIPFELAPYGQAPNTKGLIWLALAGVIALGMVLGYRYLTTRKKAQIELTGAQYRQLAEEYRRLANLAITAQEHTDLKLRYPRPFSSPWMRRYPWRGSAAPAAPPANALRPGPADVPAHSGRPISS